MCRGRYGSEKTCGRTVMTWGRQSSKPLDNLCNGLRFFRALHNIKNLMIARIRHCLDQLSGDGIMIGKVFRKLVERDVTLNLANSIHKEFDSERFRLTQSSNDIRAIRIELRLYTDKMIFHCFMHVCNSADASVKIGGIIDFHGKLPVSVTNYRVIPCNNIHCRTHSSL